MDAGSTMRVGQVARLLNVSTQRVEQLASAGRLTYSVTPLGRLYDAKSVHRLAAERAEQALTNSRVRTPKIAA